MMKLLLLLCLLCCLGRLNAMAGTEIMQVKGTYSEGYSYKRSDNVTIWVSCCNGKITGIKLEPGKDTPEHLPEAEAIFQEAKKCYDEQEILKKGS